MQTQAAAGTTRRVAAARRLLGLDGVSPWRARRLARRIVETIPPPLTMRALDAAQQDLPPAARWTVFDELPADVRREAWDSLGGTA